MTSLLELHGIVKRFPGTVALAGVDFSVRAGEIHGLVGENGAGKSTLIKIMVGALRMDEGTIALRGRPLGALDPHRAHQLGIAFVPQELSVVPGMTVAENILLGIEPHLKGFLVDRSSLRARAREVLASLGVSIDPGTLVGDLSIPQRQLVQIARAVAHRFDILILDEPTSALTEQETENLFQVLRRLRDEGKGIVYISHRLQEFPRIADRVTVLRNGTRVATWPIAEATHQRMVQAMIGRETRGTLRGTRETVRTADPPLLEVKNVSGKGFEDVSFVLRAGEVLGIGGLIGAGRTEMIRALFGADRLQGGQVLVEGREVTIQHPADAIRFGLGLVPEERRRQAIFPLLSIMANVSVPILHRFARFGVVRPAAERTTVSQLVLQMNVRAAGLRQRINQLSGGNQQKAVLARWVGTQPRVLMLDEPTRGIDVDGKAEIHALIQQLSAQGLGILIVSSDFDELLRACDRILIMREGRVRAEVWPSDVSEGDLVNLAMGLAPEGE